MISSRRLPGRRRLENGSSKPAGEQNPQEFVRRIRKTNEPGKRGKSAKASSDAIDPFSPLWSLAAFETTSRCRELSELYESLTGAAGRPASKMAGRRRQSAGVKTKHKSKQQQRSVNQLAEWMQSAQSSQSLEPVELLLLLHLQVQIEHRMPDDVELLLWRTALAGAVALSGQLGSADDGELTPDQQLLVYGELPWMSGSIFSAVKGSKRFAEDGRRFLRAQLLDSTDTDGTPRADLVERMAFWLAPLVRAAEWADRDRTNVWNEESAERFQLVLEAGCTMCKSDGRFGLSNGFTANVAPMLATGSRLAGLKKKSAPQQYLSRLERAVRRAASARNDLRYMVYPN